MKRISYILFLVFVMSTLGACSEIPENNDPVIGIWAQTRAPEDPGAKHLQRVEWIFNDAYLGRYHVYEGTEITISTDFQWEARGTVYTIHYPGLKKVEDVVRIKQSKEGIMLIDEDGNVLAFRE